jgi:acyl-CoA synthetase (AMP-forming)/AMP-acid ligase II
LPRVLDTAEALRVATVDDDGGWRALGGVTWQKEGDVLEVHAPTVMLGYLDDAEATRAAFVERDGRRWVRAHAIDRVDAPALERAIAATPGVREAAVLAVRDAAGERYYVFVAGDATAVARHPARVVTLDSLPHRPDGAVDREALRRMASAD